MCGLCGVIHFTDQPIAQHVLQAMTDRLRHRGPDMTAIAQPSPSVGLGHTRLKVIDLTASANQPMANDDDRVWIVYNGEIYNYRSLRIALEQQGRRFRSQSDTEVILRAYEAWGDACVARLDGMFAFAIYDGRQRQVLLARDRTGKKPLFYHRHHGRLVFASEIKALLIHPEVPVIFHERVLPRYLTYGYVPSPETFYKDILSLPPATQLTIDLTTGEQRLQQYWQLNVASPARAVSRQTAIDGVRDRLTEAVRKRLVADVPLGAFLSGGIDSTIVVGLMSRLMDHEVHTFSIGFRGDARFDETAYARIAATHFQTRHTEFVVEPNAFDLIERLIYYHDQPFGDASAIPTFLLCGLAKAHVTVALNGDGGDECFAGYRRFQAAVASAALPRWVSRTIAQAMARLPAMLQRQTRLGELRRFCEAAQWPWDERLVRWIAYFPEPLTLLRPELRHGLSADLWLAPARRWLGSVRNASPLAQALYLNFQEYLPNDLHVKMDRCSMAHGLETRSPFLDTQLIEYAAALPDRYKLRGLRTKVILKAAFADLLPPSIRRRGKQGFGVPLDAWFRTELREAVADLMLAPDAQLRCYLEPRVIDGYYRAHLRGERRWGLQLWNLLALEVWLRMLRRGVWSDRTFVPRETVAVGHVVS